MKFSGIITSICSLTVLFACEAEQPAAPQAPPDTAAPRITLELRNRTGDGLVEVRATWYDPDGALIDPPLRLTVDGQAIHDLWARTGGDGTFIDMKEPLEVLLAAGKHEIVGSVTDSAGRTGSDTLHLDLPHLTHLGSVGAELTSQGPLSACGDPRRVFIGTRTGVLAVDALTLTSRFYPTPDQRTGDSGMEFLACAREEGALYSANGLQRFDVKRNEWSHRMNEAEGYAIAPAKGTGTSVLVGSSYGMLSEYNRTTGQLLKQIRLPFGSPISQAAIVSIAVAPANERIFVTQFGDSSYGFNAAWDFLFRLPYAFNWVALTSDGRRAFGITPFGPGVVEFEPATGRIMNTRTVPGAWKIDIRPDDQVAFVITTSRGGGGSNYLFDLRAAGVAELARVRSNTWYEGGAAWVSSLKRLVVFRSEEFATDQFDVYLDRS